MKTTSRLRLEQKSASPFKYHSSWQPLRRFHHHYLIIIIPGYNSVRCCNRGLLWNLLLPSQFVPRPLRDHPSIRSSRRFLLLHRLVPWFGHQDQSIRRYGMVMWFGLINESIKWFNFFVLWEHKVKKGKPCSRTHILAWYSPRVHHRLLNNQ